ncbi:MAG: heavy-metal-associated domain-containing protein [Bacteroidia bacterium]|nr:heavy-metal-associated domain-containing protein [Bacteroidia bacterium]NNF31816.1 heavy-metal-associated domain-containing protein [Flavobacteriaceae bacterium]MBT8276245.1 heavy-metal-associated domain-containing protein [Bacteroidia bacterium]NNJ81193.1 heavy-metal-associated domain-containing protein [Flavobacteriaceae bacterium]NNK53345.1 heavy-metal-associated domain-containing protein [Flavobacteriaceae bacterium]
MKITRAIQNLKCGGCANTVRKGLEGISGISEISVDNDTSEVTFNYETTENFNEAHKKLISLGYPFEDDDNPLMTRAKSYVSCAIGRMSPSETENKTEV